MEKVEDLQGLQPAEPSVVQGRQLVVGQVQVLQAAQVVQGRRVDPGQAVPCTAQLRISSVGSRRRPQGLTVKVESRQPPVLPQVVRRHLGDGVEGQVQAQGPLRYRGDAAQASPGAVAVEGGVAATAGRPVPLQDGPPSPPAEGQPEDEEDKEHRTRFRGSAFKAQEQKEG